MVSDSREGIKHACLWRIYLVPTPYVMTVSLPEEPGSIETKSSE